jgi:flagellar biosynthesis protein FliQ
LKYLALSPLLIFLFFFPVSSLFRSALLLSAEICSSNEEPGFYSVLMAVMNVGEGLQQTLVSFLLTTFTITETSFSYLPHYVFIVFVSIFLPLSLLSPLFAELLKRREEQKDGEERGKGKKKKKNQ